MYGKLILIQLPIHNTRVYRWLTPSSHMDLYEIYISYWKPAVNLSDHINTSHFHSIDMISLQLFLPASGRRWRSAAEIGGGGRYGLWMANRVCTVQLMRCMYMWERTAISVQCTAIDRLIQQISVIDVPVIIFVTSLPIYATFFCLHGKEIIDSVCGNAKRGEIDPSRAKSGLPGMERGMNRWKIHLTHQCRMAERDSEYIQAKCAWYGWLLTSGLTVAEERCNKLMWPMRLQYSNGNCSRVIYNQIWPEWICRTLASYVI